MRPPPLQCHSARRTSCSPFEVLSPPGFEVPLVFYAARLVSGVLSAVKLSESQATFQLEGSVIMNAESGAADV